MPSNTSEILHALSPVALVDFYGLWIQNKVLESPNHEGLAQSLIVAEGWEKVQSKVEDAIAKRLEFDDEFLNEIHSTGSVGERMLRMTLVGAVARNVAEREFHIKGKLVSMYVTPASPEGKLIPAIDSFFEHRKLNQTGLRTKEEIVADYLSGEEGVSERHYAQPAEAPEIDGVMKAVIEKTIPGDREFPTLAIASGGTNLRAMYGDNSLNGKFKIQGEAHQQLTDQNRESKDTNEFWELFISDEVIEWLKSKAESHDAIPVGFTPAFPVEFRDGDYFIKHCSGKHRVPGFAPYNEADAEKFDRTNQIGVKASLRDFFVSKGLGDGVIEKLKINVCPNDTFAASGMTSDGGMIVGTGWNISLGKTNMEFGQYRGFEPTEVDYLVSHEVKDPNINLEWLSCGKYMYQYLRTYVRLIMGTGNSLSNRLEFFFKSKDKTNEMIARLSYEEDFDVNVFGKSGEIFTDEEQELLRGISTQIMNRSAEAVCESLVATVAVYEAKGEPQREQYVFGTDGSIALKNTGFVDQVNNRLKALDNRISILPFEAKDISEDLSGSAEAITPDATSYGTAQYAVAAYQCDELGLAG